MARRVRACPPELLCISIPRNRKHLNIGCNLEPLLLYLASVFHQSPRPCVAVLATRAASISPLSLSLSSFFFLFEFIGALNARRKGFLFPFFLRDRDGIILRFGRDREEEEKEEEEERVTGNDAISSLALNA